MSLDDAAEPAGFGNPPRQHRIRAGEVRNPWRRKGKPRPEVDFLDEPVPTKIDGKTLLLTRDQLLDHALFREGVKGNVSAIRELERRRRDRALAAKAGAGDEHLASEDQRAFDRYIDRALRDRAMRGDGATAPRRKRERTKRSKPRPDAAGGPA